MNGEPAAGNRRRRGPRRQNALQVAPARQASCHAVGRVSTAIPARGYQNYAQANRQSAVQAAYCLMDIAKIRPPDLGHLDLNQHKYFHGDREHRKFRGLVSWNDTPGMWTAFRDVAMCQSRPDPSRRNGRADDGLHLLRFQAEKIASRQSKAAVKNQAERASWRRYGCRGEFRHGTAEASLDAARRRDWRSTPGLRLPQGRIGFWVRRLVVMSATVLSIAATRASVAGCRAVYALSTAGGYWDAILRQNGTALSMP